ncbi:MAG: nuclear transport factor 2 family protein [Flavobacteriales bacterium]|jgi:uncharacterized protein (TIGR02246 family)|nr:nuclear transport factor 2 family protein [Flavobacteriales bacterium]
MEKMKNEARQVVDRMFAAFAQGDADAFVGTVSDDTVWTYHGTQVIPKGTFEGKEGVRKFFKSIVEGSDILHFEPTDFIVEGNKVVVLGHEHQRVKRSGKELKQQWVQVYTVENGLITKMEEFASSEVVKEGST